MRRSDFTGTGKVFSFTLGQYMKNKSTIVMLVLMLVMSSVCMFMMAASFKDMGMYEFNAQSLIVVNETQYTLNTEDIAAYSGELDGVEISVFEGDFDSVRDTINSAPNTAAARVEQGEDGTYYVTVYVGVGSSLTDYTASTLSAAVSEALSAARFRDIGVSDAQMDIAFAPFTVENMSYGEYTEIADDEPAGGMATFILTYAYSIIVMMLVMFSTSYIVRSIVEEKASKLVELLMVSVKPLALILGKILATMLFMVVSMLALVAGAGISSYFIGRFMNISLFANMLGATGIDLSVSGVGILMIFVIFISITLGYLTFSIIGGISGACCSSMEDINSANTAVSLLSLTGYLTAIIASAFGDRVFLTICSLCPVISVFTAPVSYASGVIGFGTLILSWLLQIAVIILLASFGAKVYGALIIHRGNRIKLRQLIKIARDSSRKAGV